MFIGQNRPKTLNKPLNQSKNQKWSISAIGNITSAMVLVHNIFQLNMNASFDQLERLQIVQNLRISLGSIKRISCGVCNGGGEVVVMVD